METDPGRSPLVVQLIILAVLTFINAMYAMSEMALVSSSKAKLKAIAEDTEDGDARAERVLKLMDDPNRFLSAIQVAITLAGFLSSAFASYNLSDRFTGWLSGLGLEMSPQVAVVIITALLSYFSLVLGELFPKKLALIDPEKTAMNCVGLVSFTKSLFRPFVWLLSASVNGLCRLFDVHENTNESEYMEEEIINLLETGQEQGEIDESGKDMINSIFDLDDAMAVEIMTPRTDVFMICIDDEPADYIDEFLEERHARVPVYGEDQDDIRGILYLKDFIIEARNVGFDNVKIEPILKKPYLAPEGKKVNELLKEMQQNKQQIALLIDEYGGFSGIVTIEDILEEIVGSIEEEYEDDAPKLERQEDGSYIVDGLFNLEDLSEELGIKFESENNDTVAGFVTDLSGEVPDEDSVGQEFGYENCVFKILSVTDRRIEKIGLTVNEPEEDAEEKEEE